MSGKRARTPDERSERSARTRAPSLVIVNTGDGKGKTTAAMGIVIRAVARGWKVCVIQFIKSGRWRVGEEKVAKDLGVDWWSLGDGFSWDSDDLDRSADLARAAWQRAKEEIASGGYDVVVLDEVTYPMSWGWIPTDEGGGRDPRTTRTCERDGHRQERASRARRDGRHRHRNAEGPPRVRPGDRSTARDRLLMALAVLFPAAHRNCLLVPRLAADGASGCGRLYGGSPRRDDDRADPPASTGSPVEWIIPGRAGEPRRCFGVVPTTPSPGGLPPCRLHLTRLRRSRLNVSTDIGDIGMTQEGRCASLT
jgi:hypothetical protein